MSSTTTSSAIIQNIEKSGCNRGSAHLAYFFFDFNDARKQDARAFLSSILVQLSNQSTSFLDILLEFYSTHQRGSQQPSDDALIQCLEKMLQIPSKLPIYVIIDALDECPVTSGVQSPREKVLALVKTLAGLRLPNLRICITSRPDVDIRNVLEPLLSPSNCITLHEEDGQKKSMADYIRSVVNSDETIMKWSEEDKELVIETLSGKAGGMYERHFLHISSLTFIQVSVDFVSIRRLAPPWHIKFETYSYGITRNPRRDVWEDTTRNSGSQSSTRSSTPTMPVCCCSPTSCAGAGGGPCD